MARQWYILQNSEKYGPYSEEQIRSFVNEGRLKENTLVWCRGMKGWARAADVEPFKSHFVKQARPVAGPEPTARAAITAERRGGGRKIAAVGVLIIVIVAVLGIWWIYPQLSGQSTQPQSEQPTQTGPAFGEAEGTLHTAYQDGVHDGDTIYVSVPLTLANPESQSEISDPNWTSFVGVRFAMIAAPELGENGSYEAGNFVKQLIADGGNKVYLDLDNDARSQTGQRFRDVDGNRLVAVVYVQINNKLINVNAEVIRFGEDNFGADWRWYIYPGTGIYSEFENDVDTWLSPSYQYVR